ncbi:MAG: hypothetical protein ACRBBM_00585 [Pseudomonadaceae bacterium]|jgi:hypothetical protein
MIKAFRKLACAVRGHRYPTNLFDNFSLCFCKRCGQEVAGRTWEDILDAPDDDDYPDYDSREQRHD